MNAEARPTVVDQQLVAMRSYEVLRQHTTDSQLIGLIGDLEQLTLHLLAFLPIAERHVDQTEALLATIRAARPPWWRRILR